MCQEKRGQNVHYGLEEDALTGTLVHFLAEHGFDQLVEVGIVRKDDVPALVPDKPVAIDV